MYGWLVQGRVVVMVWLAVEDGLTWLVCLAAQGRELDTRTTVYKKKDIIYQLKMKASRREYFIYFFIVVHGCAQYERNMEFMCGLWKKESLKDISEGIQTQVLSFEVL